ncbi:MAG: circularly permuted type 2 ATP-grasp protein, partial [Actinomycetota bacterium]|nr:circularly permuted type 2 ATP-grasp protein [Actinomycetota bacterium]
YETVFEELTEIGPERWEENLRRAHSLLLEEQYAFGILKGDKTHPTDWFPRVVPAADWERLERGLVQRMRAINEFLRRLEAGVEEVVPKEVIETSILYDTTVPNRFGEVPVRQVAFDVVAIESGQTGGWEYVLLEENAKMPVGLAAMTRRRRMSREVFFPGALAKLPVLSLDGWLTRLGDSLRAASPKGPEATLAVISSGPDDQFYLDHHIYAKEMGAILAETKHLAFDRGGHLVHEPTGRRIDVIYERVDEDTLYADLPELIDCHVEGRVHVLFAPNSEVVDDKGVEVFIPEMIRRYLGEEPLIKNARTWSLAVPEERRYVMEHFGELVVKSRGGYGGKEVMIGPEESKESIERFRQVVERNPVEYIAQELVDFSTHVLCEADVRNEGFILQDSYADYRLLSLAPDPVDPDVVEIVPGSLARVAAPGSYLTNISSGGKMKDTWVLERRAGIERGSQTWRDSIITSGGKMKNAWGTER